MGIDSEIMQFILAARDNASGTVRRVGTELNTLGGAGQRATGPLNRLSAATGGLVSPATLAIGATAGLVAAGAKFIDMAREEQVGIARLTTAIRENDKVNTTGIEGVEEAIDARQRLAFADDEQRESLAPLIAVTQDSAKALELQRVAMDLSRLKGIDLRTSSELLGKVYAGNIGILSRYGIQLAKGTTATEAIEEIQRRAAGQAEAYADTQAGAAESAGIALENLAEDIGQELLPIVTDLAIVVRDDLVPALKELAPLLDLTNRNSADGIPVLEQLEDIFNGVGDASIFVGDALRFQTGAVDRWRTQTGQSYVDAQRDLKEYQDAHGVTFDQAERELRHLAQTGPVLTARMQAEMAQAVAVSPVRQEFERLAADGVSIMSAEAGAFRDAAFQTQVEYAKGLLEGQEAPKVQMEALRQLQKETLTKTAEENRLIGQLTSQRLAQGLADTRPVVRAQAEAARLAIVNQLATLGVDAHGWGLSTAEAFAAGLGNGYGVVLTEAGKLAAAVRGQIGIESEPRDPRSPLRGITRWGGNAAHTWAEGFRKESEAIGTAMGGIVPGGAGKVSAPARGGGGSGLTVIFASTYPPTPAQADDLARSLLPAIERERRRQGFVN